MKRAGLSDKLVQLSLLFLLGSACQSQPPIFHGEIQGAWRDSLYLFRWEAGQWVKVASTALKEGRFAFRQTLPAGIYLWGFSPQEGDIVVLRPGTSPFLRGEMNTLFQRYTYEQSPENAQLLAFRRQTTELYRQLEFTSGPQRETLQQQLEAHLRRHDSAAFSSLRLYARLLRLPSLSATSYPTLEALWKGLVEAFWDKFPWQDPWIAQTPDMYVRLQNFWQNAVEAIPEDTLLVHGVKWVQALPQALQPSAWMALIEVAQRYQLKELMLIAAERFKALAPQDSRIPQLEAFIQAESRLRKGQTAPDIALPDPQGVIRRLSDLRGKWVLIDFWASWCRPCRLESPHLRQVYQRYHSRGFEIFSVSLDYNREAWTQAIQTDQLSWIHVSDLKGWQSAAAQLYRVNAIPFTVLIDPEGRIAAKGLRGSGLEARLAQIFP
ncbi:MAG: TlpA disulfide reductase family protein [Bacteroidia bacterium]